MAITRQEIEHIAVLARLEMSGERFDHLAVSYTHLTLPTN